MLFLKDGFIINQAMIINELVARRYSLVKLSIDEILNYKLIRSLVFIFNVMLVDVWSMLCEGFFID